MPPPDPVGLVNKTEFAIKTGEPVVTIVNVETHTPLQLAEILGAEMQGPRVAARSAS